jgi:RND superfamily putative drug exporter
MATFLFRLGRAAYRGGIKVVIAWVLIAAGVLAGGVALGGVMKDSFDIPGTESQEALDLLSAVFPQTAGASAQIVVQDPTGAAMGTNHGADIAKLVDDLGNVDGVESAGDPYGQYANAAASEDRSSVIVQVQFSEPSSDVTPQMLDDVRAATKPLTDEGLVVAFGGQVFQHVSFGVSIVEGIGVLFAALVLIVTFGSLVAAGLPLLIAFIALGVSMGGVLAASAFTTLSSSTPMLALMIGLAVGIDYALFILSRHRSQLAAGMDPEESTATAVATAGSSVVFAGLTVVIALAGLLVVGIPFLGVMGIAAAVAVVLAMLAATTLLPAILGMLKGRLKPKVRKPKKAKVAKPSFGQRWVTTVLKAPAVAVIGVIAILGALAIPAFSLQLALPDGASQPEGSTTRTAYDIVTDEFGPGRNGPLVVTVDITQTNDVVADLDAIGTRLSKLDGVASVSRGIPNPSLDTAIIQVIPTTGPSDPATADLVREIRSLEPKFAAEDTPIAVTGATAVSIDISERLDSALLPFGLIVVGLSVLLLMLVFRSILVPIKAALGYLLSVFAAFGVVVAVFQWGWGAELLHAVPGPILSFMPVLLMAILFGLAMDYEVFLVSGMREAYVHGVAAQPGADKHQRNAIARAAIVKGFSGAARVVTAAAAIMFFVFASFVPEGAGAIKVIALGLAVGIVVDAFLVRMTLVPAVMALAGRAAWYLPMWLNRLLPNVDIEGEGLRTHRDAVEWALGRLAAGDAITVDALVAGPGVGPVTLSVPSGAIALVGGDPAERRVLAATVAGRLEPRAGRAQVVGHPVPAESSRVARLVALADLGGSGRTEVAVTVGELLDERLRLTASPLRWLQSERLSRRWLDRVTTALSGLDAATVRVTLDSRVAELPRLERAVALAAVALAERSPVVLLDVADPLPENDARALLVALDRLVPVTTTVVLGTPGSRHLAVGAPARVQLVVPETQTIPEEVLS